MCNQQRWHPHTCPPGHQLIPRARDVLDKECLVIHAGCATVRSHPVINELLRERQRYQPELTHIKLVNKRMTLTQQVGKWWGKKIDDEVTHIILVCSHDLGIVTAGAC